MIYRSEKTFSGSYVFVRNNDSNAAEYRYDITGLISIAQYFKERKCDYRFIVSLIYRLSEKGRLIEKSEVDINGWILDPSYIYIYQEKESDEVEYQKVIFIYFSESTDLKMEQGMLGLAEFLIEHADYSDEKAIDIAYRFYMQVYVGDYTFDTLIKK